MMALGLGYAEIAIIMVIALIVIGPKRLPQLMRDFGRIMGQLRRASDDLRREVLFSDEIESVKDSISDAVNPFTPPPVPPRIKVKNKSASSEDVSDSAGLESSTSAPEQAPSTEKPDQGDGADEQ